MSPLARMATKKTNKKTNKQKQAKRRHCIHHTRHINAVEFTRSQESIMRDHVKRE